ncbi:serine/threonine protein kinase [Nostoc sp.]|uniref:serine/threonine protein kinase n=1 Tax=Nostoc sp. TaxID=1180 RepID=UPI002FFBC615
MFNPEDILQERYQLVELQGRTITRQTWLAKDLNVQQNELVIVKILDFSSELQWQHFNLFEREAKTLKSLSHPSIPRYLDYFPVNTPNLKGFALVQTYIPAQTLEQQMKAGRTFTEVEVKEIAKAVLEILIYLHQQNPPVIHRDLKPSNILLTNRSGNSVGQIYLVDFGSVQTIAASEGGTMTVVGTYGYMPPEQFGSRTVPASDLYSLGATLIYLVTGTHPADFPQQDFRIQFEQVVNLSSTFINWLRWMIEPNLEHRLNSASEALDSLECNRIPTILPKPKGSERIRARLVVTTKSPNELEIEARDNQSFISEKFKWFVVIGLLVSTLLGIFFGSMAFVISMVYFSCMIMVLWKPIVEVKNIHSIYFNKRLNNFVITLKTPFSFKQQLGAISDIKYIAPDEIQIDYYNGVSVTIWNVKIRAIDRNYVLKNWRLSESECFWLVRELESWLNV